MDAADRTTAVAADPFDTAALRRAVLDAWTVSPARFREDANAEEDLVRGGYRGRWLVELAQNAADAAGEIPTVLRLRFSAEGAAGELRVGNRGAPLDAAGVAALASLRASAKRTGDTVGRFGVGFAAVLALTDAPRVVARAVDGAVGVVGFDRARAFEAAVAAGGGLADEARRRGPAGAPALRLVWPGPPEDLDDDLTTEIRLPLAVPAGPLRAQALAEAEDLLLALPGLAAVEVDGERTARHADGRRVTVGATAWTTLPIGGALPAGDLAVEDRGRDRWEGLWLVRDPAPGVVVGPDPRDVLHAPTPTAETTTLPARLVATVPLDADRRRVRPGAVTTAVLRAAGRRYPDLVGSLPAARRLALVPRPGLPASEVDALLRESALEALRHAAWLPGADGQLVAPARAVALVEPTPALVAALAGALPGLLDADARDRDALAALDVPRLGPAAVADRLAGLDRAPAWWRAVYAALAAVPGLDRAELAALPVPLADGRLAIGARGTLLPGPGVAVPGRDGPALRLVHPDAAHPLLEALGARPADGAALLDEPEVREAVERSVDDAEAGLDVAPLARFVLSLPVREAAGLGALALPDDDGGHRRADELVLPDGALRAVLGDDSPVGVLAARAVEEHGRDALVAAGVLDGFALVHDEEPTGPDHDLDDEETWWAEEVDPDPGFRGAAVEPLGPPAALTAVRDLDLVVDWAAAWELLASDREVRAALVWLPGEPLPYTAWWLARHGRLGGHRPGHWRLPGGPPATVPAGAAAALAALYDPAPTTLDIGFLTAIGVRSRLRVADAADALDLLARLADPTRTVPPGAAAAAHTALAEAVAQDRVAVSDLDPPARVRVASGAVVDADPDRDPAPLVLDRPWLLPALEAGRVVPVAPDRARTLAELLDLPCAGDEVHGEIRSPGTPMPWTALADAVAWAAAAGRELPPGEVVLHERLRVAVGRRELFPGVWVDDDGGPSVHTDDPVRALLAAWSV